jgi:hypothetical protein
MGGTRVATRIEVAPAERRGITRRGLLKSVPGAAVGLATTTWLYQQPLTRQVLRVLLTAAPAPPSAPSPIANAPAGYFHACFSVDTPEDVARAAALGINYTICYGSASYASADPTSAQGQALARYGMRTFLDIESSSLSCRSGQGQVDVSKVRELVGRFAQSPLLAGYWTKDDDCGNEGAAVKDIASLIRSIDPDPRHLIMPGYGVAASVARNYVHGQGDVLGFYTYPAQSYGPAVEVPEMLRIVRERTPRGAQPPPFIGIYQVFGSPPSIRVPTVQDVVKQVATYRALGAVGVGGYAWQQYVGLSHLPVNDATLRQAIAAVTQWMISGPGRAYKHGIQAGG